MKNHKILLLLFVLLISHTGAADTYRILITNDDGIDSPLLIALTEALRADYDVIVAAPRENQSGSSHSSNSSAPLKVEQIYRDGQLFGYGIHGRPADAARFGIRHLGKEKPFDVVISGINRGANVGDVAHLSGTVGAAFEGLYQGIPSVAVSQDRNANTEISIQLTRQVLQQILSNGIPTGTLLSINVPAGDINGVVAKPMGGSYLTFRPYDLVEEDNNSTTYQSGLAIASLDSADNDTRAYQQGFATITPLKFNWTDTELLPTINEWSLDIKQ